MKLKNALSIICIASTLSTKAATVIADLGGLLTPTGPAFNSNNDRQYSYTTVGGEVTVVYTLSTSNANLSVAMGNDNLFRYPDSNNIPSGENLTITINSISANAGFILNSTTGTDTVTVASNSANIARFSVNGGPTFDFTPASGGQATRDFTDTRFLAFDNVGDSIFFENVDQSTNGGMNLRGIDLTFDVTTIPEPSSAALIAIGGLTIILRRRK